MAMGRQEARQGDLMMAWDELPRSPGHAFYDKLQDVLVDAKFDEHAENICKPYYAEKMGTPSLPPGRYFRMHLIGYFEGIDSERALEWRCSDSLSLRDFLRLGPGQRVPDHSTLPKTLEAAKRNLAKADAAPTKESPAECIAAECIADKGYHNRDGIKKMDGGVWKTRICEPDRPQFNRWHGDDEARRAVYNNRARLQSKIGKKAMKLRAEIVERSFQHILDRGGMRRAHLRGNENLRKRYLLHVAGFNLSLVMRQILGHGTPKQVASGENTLFILFLSVDGAILPLMLAIGGDPQDFSAIILFSAPKH